MSDLFKKLTGSPTPFSSGALSAAGDAAKTGNVSTGVMPERDLALLRTVLGGQEVSCSSTVPVGRLLAKTADIVLLAAVQLNVFAASLGRGAVQKDELYKLQARMKSVKEALEFGVRYVADMGSGPEHASFAEAVERLSSGHAQLTDHVLGEAIWDKISRGSEDRLDSLERALIDLWGSTHDAWIHATSILTQKNVFPWIAMFDSDDRRFAAIMRDQVYPAELQAVLGGARADALQSVDRRLELAAARMRSADQDHRPSVEDALRALWGERTQITNNARREILERASEQGVDRTVDLLHLLQRATLSAHMHHTRRIGSPLPNVQPSTAFSAGGYQIPSPLHSVGSASPSTVLAENGFPFPRHEVMLPSGRRVSAEEIAELLAQTFSLEPSRAVRGDSVHQPLTQSPIVFHERLVAPMSDAGSTRSTKHVEERTTRKEIGDHRGVHGGPGEGELVRVTVDPSEVTGWPMSQGSVSYWLERSGGAIVDGGWIVRPEHNLFESLRAPPGKLSFASPGASLSHDDPSPLAIYVSSLIAP